MSVLETWVLRDRKKYLREWTMIGPRTTLNLAEALRFSSEGEAMKHPAYSFELTSFDAVQVK
jgi:hypothetical protein